jgi:hypothetical protein
MKLIYCSACHDIVKLEMTTRTCKCGKSGGRNVDDIVAEIEGDAVPFGINNTSFAEALSKYPTSKKGTNFIAWVIAKNARHVVRVGPKK